MPEENVTSEDGDLRFSPVTGKPDLRYGGWNSRGRGLQRDKRIARAIGRSGLLQRYSPGQLNHVLKIMYSSVGCPGHHLRHLLRQAAGLDT